MRPTRVTTETAIPTVFQVELVEAAETGTAEEVDEGEVVGFQDVTSGTVEPIDGIVRVSDEMGRTTADLVDESEMDVRVCVGEEVDETVDDAKESVVVGPFGGNRTFPRSGKRGLMVVVTG